MKKILVFLLCGIVSGAVFAQGAKSRWYVQALLGANNTGTETMSIGTFKKNVGFSGSIEGGYEINPYIGVGLNLSQNRLHYMPASESLGFNGTEASLNLNWNLSQTLLRYLDGRKNNIRLYAGVAGIFSSSLAANGYNDDKGRPNDNAFGFRGGVQYERVIKGSWSAMLDAGINVFGDAMDGKPLALLNKAYKGTNDAHVNVMVGVRKYFGYGASRRHRADFKETIWNDIVKRDTTIIKERVEKRHPRDVYSIFFERDKIDIRTSQVSKIQAVADFMKANPEKVVFVFGYADKNTGTTQRNKWLATNRARVIIEQLTNTYGIDPARILTYEQEGDRVQPFAEEEFEKNRATICVITDLERQ